MPSPRCVSHMKSVGEYIIIFNEARYKYRKEFNDDAEKVSAALMRLMDLFGIEHPCCRSMILNCDTREDFMARRKAY